MGDTIEQEVTHAIEPTSHIQVIIPRWWSPQTLALFETLESRISFLSSALGKDSDTRPIHVFVALPSSEWAPVPTGLPIDMYSPELKNLMVAGELEKFLMKPACLPQTEDMQSIIPKQTSDKCDYDAATIVDLQNIFEVEPSETGEDEDESSGDEDEDESSGDDEQVDLGLIFVGEGSGLNQHNS